MKHILYTVEKWKSLTYILCPSTDVSTTWYIQGFLLQNKFLNMTMNYISQLH